MRRWDRDLGKTEESLASMDRVLSALRDQDPTMSRVVECRFFAGLSVEQTGDALGISSRAVLKRWSTAMEFILANLEGVPSD
jgi:DNA-directed RNA polymerase specialized sigma24 family protein